MKCCMVPPVCSGDQVTSARSGPGVIMSQCPVRLVTDKVSQVSANMDMYEINRRRGSRNRKKQKNAFKSIPNLHIQDYEEEFYSYTPGVFNDGLNDKDDNHDPSRMYRSLGYIPSCHTEMEDWSNNNNTWKRSASKKGRKARQDREEKLWSKSSDQLADVHYYDQNNDRSSEYVSDVWQRYHPGGRSELVAAAPQQAGVSESYQHNYPLVKDQYEPYSLPYTNNFNRHVTQRGHVRHVQPPVMVGMMRCRRDLIFSRWQERTFVLTTKYLKCYDKSNATSFHPHHHHQAVSAQLPQVKPQILWKIKLSNLENMDLTTKKGHLTIKLLVHGDNCKYLLRSGHDTRHWFNMIMTCCNQSVASNMENQYWENQPQPPSRSESIQRWLLGRPSAVVGVSQPQSLQYQHFQDYSYNDCHWVHDQQTYGTVDNKHRQKKSSRPKTSMSSKMIHSHTDKSGKMFKNENQDSGNSSLSTPTLSSSKTKYQSLPQVKKSNF